jgi:hypothetical protein
MPISVLKKSMMTTKVLDTIDISMNPHPSGRSINHFYSRHPALFKLHPNPCKTGELINGLLVDCPQHLLAFWLHGLGPSFTQHIIQAVLERIQKEFPQEGQK